MNMKALLMALIGTVVLSGCGHFHKGKCGCNDCGSKQECPMDKEGKGCSGDCHKAPESK